MAESVRSRISHPRTRNCIPRPADWALALIQNHRKFRCRSALKVWSRSPAAVICENNGAAYFLAWAEVVLTLVAIK